MKVKETVLSGGRTKTDITIDILNSCDMPQTISAVTVNPDKSISWSIFGQRSPAVAREMAQALIKAAEIAERSIQ
jgi:hypothetical protein